MNDIKLDLGKVRSGPTIADLEKQSSNLKEFDKSIEICCSHSSVGGIKLITQSIISIAVLAFSFVMIAESDPEADNSIYWSILSSVLSFHLGASQKK